MTPVSPSPTPTPTYRSTSSSSTETAEYDEDSNMSNISDNSHSPEELHQSNKCVCGNQCPQRSYIRSSSPRRQTAMFDRASYWSPKTKKSRFGEKHNTVSTRSTESGMSLRQLNIEKLSTQKDIKELLQAMFDEQVATIEQNDKVENCLSAILARIQLVEDDVGASKQLLSTLERLITPAAYEVNSIKVLICAIWMPDNQLLGARFLVHITTPDFHQLAIYEKQAKYLYQMDYDECQESSNPMPRWIVLRNRLLIWGHLWNNGSKVHCAVKDERKPKPPSAILSCQCIPNLTADTDSHISTMCSSRRLAQDTLLAIRHQLQSTHLIALKSLILADTTQ